MNYSQFGKSTTFSWVVFRHISPVLDLHWESYLNLLTHETELLTIHILRTQRLQGVARWSNKCWDSQFNCVEEYGRPESVVVFTYGSVRRGVKSECFCSSAWVSYIRSYHVHAIFITDSLRTLEKVQLGLHYVDWKHAITSSVCKPDWEHHMDFFHGQHWCPWQWKSGRHPNHEFNSPEVRAVDPSFIYPERKESVLGW